MTAVDRAVHGHFDLILLSSDLPRLDGIEATRILKNYAATRDVPVLLLIPSGQSDHENFAYDPIVQITRVYDEVSGVRVLAMTLIDGMRVDMIDRVAE